MKSLFLLLIFLPFGGKTQKAILMDRALFAPVQVVDSVTLDEVTGGLMPVYVKDIDSILKVLEWLMTYVNEGKAEKGLLDLKAGQSRWTARMKKNGIKSQYNIVLNTRFGLFETYLVIASNEFNKRALQRLTIFADYLKNNQAVLSQSHFQP